MTRNVGSNPVLDRIFHIGIIPMTRVEVGQHANIGEYRPPTTHTCKPTHSQLAYMPNHATSGYQGNKEGMGSKALAVLNETGEVSTIAKVNGVGILGQ